MAALGGPWEGWAVLWLEPHKSFSHEFSILETYGNKSFARVQPVLLILPSFPYPECPAATRPPWRFWTQSQSWSQAGSTECTGTIVGTALAPPTFPGTFFHPLEG